MHIEEKRQVLSAEEMDRTLQRLAHEIVEKSGGTGALARIGVRRRGVPLAERLAHSMRRFAGVDVPVGTLDITLYRDDLSTVGAQPLLQSTEIPFLVDDREDYGEVRVRAIGFLDARLYSLVFAQDGEDIRAISHRKATRHEEKEYEESVNKARAVVRAIERARG